jgi:isopenicillin N synthase-like dioxygenase
MNPLLPAPAARPPARMIAGRLPLLDASAYLRGEPGALDALAAGLRFALEDVGFYLLAGHGIPEPLIESTFAAARRFHAQALEAKLAVRINEHNLGYMPMRGSLNRTSAYNPNGKPSLNEAFFLRRQRRADDPDVLANKPLRGLNQWPPEASLPGFRNQCLSYMAAMQSLGQRLVPVYARALGLVPDYFDRAFATPNTILRLTHYPAVDQFQEGEFSIAPHTDSGFMTLLPPNPVDGLSILGADGAWTDIPHVAGAYTINSGDMLHRWTNAVFRSTPHRVRNVSPAARYACPFFFDPHPDTMIEALPSCVGPDRQARQEPILFDDYIIWFARKNYVHQQQNAA